MMPGPRGLANPQKIKLESAESASGPAPRPRTIEVLRNTAGEFCPNRTNRGNAGPRTICSGDLPWWCYIPSMLRARFIDLIALALVAVAVLMPPPLIDAHLAIEADKADLDQLDSLQDAHFRSPGDADITV